MTTTLIINAKLATMVPGGSPGSAGRAGELGIVERGWVRVEAGLIAAIGAGDPPSVDGEARLTAVDVGGRLVTPGLIDAHTHACWAGDRSEEWQQRLAGASYLELLERGGGIMSTVRAVRAASTEELASLLAARLDLMLRHGTTTAEVKTGYGLNTATELKMLAAIDEAGRHARVHVIPTACIGHAKDPEVDEPVRVTIDETLAAVHEIKAEVAIDAYCEQGAWSMRECVALFEAARSLGHPIRVHTDQFNSLGMVEEAIRLGARSVDHLEATQPATLKQIGAAAGDGLFAVLLPASGFHLDQRYADGRALIDSGTRVVVATNLNPGSSPCASLTMAAALAVRRCGLTPDEALRAITSEAAALLGLMDRGTLSAGKRADLVVWDCATPLALTHDFGANLASRVMVGGVWMG